MAGDKSLDDAQQQMADMKAEAKGQAAPSDMLSGTKNLSLVRKIVFACDAGMGILPCTHNRRGCADG